MLTKTYLPTYQCDISDSNASSDISDISDSIDIWDSSDSSDSNNSLDSSKSSEEYKIYQKINSKFFFSHNIKKKITQKITTNHFWVKKTCSLKILFFTK